MYTLEHFQQELDQINELCEKYEEIPTIVAGDFNVYIHGKQDPRSRYFMEFIKSYNLKEIIDIRSPTFKHHSGKGK